MIRPGSVVRACAALLWVMSLGTACGYRLVGRGGAFPEGVRTVGVRTITNATRRSGIETEFSRALIAALMSTGKVKIVSDGTADAIFSGAVVRFDSSPLAYNASREITERRVTVTVDLDFTPAGGGKSFSSERGVIGKADHLVTGELIADNKAEQEAVENATKDAAERVVNRITEGF